MQDKYYFFVSGVTRLFLRGRGRNLEVLRPKGELYIHGEGGGQAHCRVLSKKQKFLKTGVTDQLTLVQKYFSSIGH